MEEAESFIARAQGESASGSEGYGP
jgi:hypothetical protein